MTMLPRELTAIIESAHKLNPKLAAFTSLLSLQGARAPSLKMERLLMLQDYRGCSGVS